MDPIIKKIYTDYKAEYKSFAANDAKWLTPEVRIQFRSLLEGEYQKELDEVLEHELFQIKSKNRLYAKLIKAQKKLDKAKKADFWYKRLFRKFGKSQLKDLMKQIMLYLKIETFTIELPKETSETLPPELPQAQPNGTSSEGQSDEHVLPSEQSQELTNDETSKETEVQEMPENAQQTEEQRAQVEEPTPTENAENAEERSEQDETSEPSDTQSKTVPDFFRPGGKSSKKK